MPLSGIPADLIDTAILLHSYEKQRYVATSYMHLFAHHSTRRMCILGYRTGILLLLGTVSNDVRISKATLCIVVRKELGSPNPTPTYAKKRVAVIKELRLRYDHLEALLNPVTHHLIIT